MSKIENTLMVSVFCFPAKKYNYFLLARSGQVLAVDHTGKDVKYFGFFGGDSQVPIFVGMVEISKEWFDWLPNSTKNEIEKKIKECVEKFGDLPFLE